MLATLLKRKQTSTKRVGIVLDAEGIAYAVLESVAPLAVDAIGFLPASRDALATVFRDWVNQEDLGGARCFATLPPGVATLVQVEPPDVDPAELDEAIRWQLDESVASDLASSVIATFPTPEDSSRGQNRLVNVVVVGKDRIRESAETITGVLPSLASIDVPELAMRNIASLYGEAGRSIAMLLVEGTSGHILCFKDDSLYFSRQIGVPGGDRETGFERLCLEVQRSIDYFESQQNQVAPRNIIVFGGEATTDVEAAIENNLGLEVLPLDLETLGIEVGRRELAHGARVSMLCALGAALREET